MSTYTVLHESAYIILFPTQRNEFINDDENEDRHISTLRLTRSFYILLMTSKSISEAVIMIRKLWIVISNSLDIDFIHGDIHGWSCRKYQCEKFQAIPPMRS